MTHEKSTKIMSLNSFVGSWWAFNSISVGEAFMDFFFGNDVITHIANRVNSLLCPSREHCSNTQKARSAADLRTRKNFMGRCSIASLVGFEKDVRKWFLWTRGKHFSPRAEVMTQFPNEPRVHFSQTLILKFKRHLFAQPGSSLLVVWNWIEFFKIFSQRNSNKSRLESDSESLY